MSASTASLTTQTKLSTRASQGIRQDLSTLTPELFRRALRLSRSPAAAEDLVQDTVERALRFEAKYRRGTNLRAWMYRILFNVFITRCRTYRRERNALYVLSTDPCAWTMHSRFVEPPPLPPPLARALSTVPKVYRDVVILVDLREYAYKEAAHRLRIPLGTVMSRLHRGRCAFADAIITREPRDAAQAPVL